MISLLIWSKDRACQLDLLLRSLPPNLFFNVCTLYKATSKEYQSGYDKLMDLYPEYFFINEEKTGGFESQTRFSIQTLADVNGYICLSTDDTVFYKSPTMTAQEIESVFEPDVVTFSFRYGFNTILQNCHTGERQPALNIYEEKRSYIRWNFDDYHPLSNYGYPFGLDMHVYDADMLSQLVNTFEFKNTNQLETNLFHLRNVVPRIICSEKQSSAVNVPCNCMSGVTIAGQEYPFSIESLNKLFLEGNRISLNSFANKSVVGCHQEFALEFEKS